jgi:hypothetical protein
MSDHDQISEDAELQYLHYMCELELQQQLEENINGLRNANHGGIWHGEKYQCYEFRS